MNSTRFDDVRFTLTPQESLRQAAKRLLRQEWADGWELPGMLAPEARRLGVSRAELAQLLRDL